MEVKIGKSGMRNLEQIRAKNALQDAPKIKPGEGGGCNPAKEVPAMIILDGFLGAMAFAVQRTDKGMLKKEGHYSVFEAIVNHLSDREIGLLEIRSKSVDDLLIKACDWNADKLRAITAESMAYLNYLRRFAKPGKEESRDGNGAQ